MGAEASTVFILSLICIIAGGALAAVASNRHPTKQAALESSGGSLIVLGLVIIGAGLTPIL